MASSVLSQKFIEEFGRENAGPSTPLAAKTRQTTLRMTAILLNDLMTQDTGAFLQMV
jgi:hypothetical protein